MKFSHLIFIYLAFLLVACKREPVVRHTESRLVVLAEITGGDTAMIPLGQSTTTREGSALRFGKVSNASVSLVNENNQWTRLFSSSNAAYRNNPTSMYTCNEVMRAGQEYGLHINHPVLGTASATTRIPDPFLLREVFAENKKLNNEEVLVFNFTVQDEAAERNFYIFEAVKQLVSVSMYFMWQGTKYDFGSPEGKTLYDQLKTQQQVELHKDTIPMATYLRLPVYTFDRKTENARFGTLDSAYARIFIQDSTFNGAAHSSFIAIPKKIFRATTEAEKGRVVVRIKSVSNELFRYLSDYERYRMDFGILPVQQLVSPRGNIQNGLGVFGGVNRQEFIYYYDDL